MISEISHENQIQDCLWFITEYGLELVHGFEKTKLAKE